MALLLNLYRNFVATQVGRSFQYLGVTYPAINNYRVFFFLVWGGGGGGEDSISYNTDYNKTLGEVIIL